MKKTLAPLLIILSLYSYGQSKNILEKPKVDERIELMSIVFRLAESKEYCTTKYKIYTDRIESHYAPYQNHELIKFIKNIRDEHGIGYDAVMAMAIHLDKSLNPLVKFTDKIPDERWGKSNSEEFVKLLKKFYRDSKSKQFFESNQALYEEASKRFYPIYEALDLDWYTKFYGMNPNEKFIIVNALGNGGANYGSSITFPDKAREVYAIMGMWNTDDSGNPKFIVDDYFPTLLHEFNHSFINHLLTKYKDDLKNDGDKIYKILAGKMQAQAYNSWETMFNEALVRAAVIKYMKDHNFGQQKVDAEIATQMNRGFLWITDLVASFDDYSNNRDKYVSFESFMPQIIENYAVYADNLETYVQRMDEKRPKVISIKEFENNAQDVNPAINTITINFDRPLLGKGRSINFGDKGKEAAPKFLDFSYSEDKKSIIIKLELEHNKEYQFILTGLAFKSTDGISMNDYLVNFKTN